MDNKNYISQDERMTLIQKLNDRLLYLSEADAVEFVSYLETLYESYPIDRVVKYGNNIA